MRLDLGDGEASYSFLQFFPDELPGRLSFQDSASDCAKFVLKPNKKDRSR